MWRPIEEDGRQTKVPFTGFSQADGCVSSQTPRSETKSTSLRGFKVNKLSVSQVVEGAMPDDMWIRVILELLESP